ncbi:MAG: ABC transporter permease [Firmicutes bacterium]|nr:ABC transporter permease [Bacillota bacterium]
MRYFVQRLGFLLLSLWAAITINFVLPRFMPGNPAEAMIARYQGRLSPMVLHSLEIEFGISNQPLWVQYGAYLQNLAHGNFGLSITYYPVPVIQIIANSLPWTLGLAGTATVISSVLGVVLGIIAAWRRGGKLDTVLPLITMFTTALPYQWLGLLILYVFGYLLGWFPTAHAYTATLTPSLTPPFIGNVLVHAILPASTIVITAVGGWLLGMRNNMINTLGEDYVVFAEAKGVKDRRLMFMYAARNAILPSLTGFGMALGFVVGGSVLVETIFSYPGVGYQLVAAVQNEDYPLMQGLFLIIAVSVLLANFIVEMLYGRVDPRVRRGGARA